jgi:hypothetical protein
MATITHLQAFGDHLLSVSRDSVMKIWDMSQCSKIASTGQLTTVESEGQIDFGEGFHVTCMVLTLRPAIRCLPVDDLTLTAVF